mgnify:CR=1 FL=1
MHRDTQKGALPVLVFIAHDIMNASRKVGCLCINMYFFKRGSGFLFRPISRALMNEVAHISAREVLLCSLETSMCVGEKGRR